MEHILHTIIIEAFPFTNQDVHGNELDPNEILTLK